MSEDNNTVIYECDEATAEHFREIAEELSEKVREYLVSHGFFSEDTVDSWYAVEVTSEHNDFVDIFVRCELYWEEFSEMICDVMDPIVQEQYPDAYFELETSGVSMCRFWR